MTKEILEGYIPYNPHSFFDGRGHCCSDEALVYYEKQEAEDEAKELRETFNNPDIIVCKVVRC